ncbi:restriction endonuclease subunit S [Rhizobium mayense]|uniref:Restriction endonuclease subunit S n=1 Tax=Rhizobium mayense TaxID=1312184 RepID=A0ABT7JRC7_9HYPH|nr:restriction endonuclease subunit S [Rhizobium mayense]MDL2398447.1 restriction endonuclease subunit S [Rhizobium mayense]
MSPGPRWSVPESWSWTSIEDIANVTGGGTPPANDPSNFADEGGIPWITPADLTGYENTYIRRGRRNLSERGYKNSAAKLLPSGAVLFTSRAPIGYCAIAANPIATNQGFKSLTLFGGLSGEFARHYLKWSKPFLESLASGTTFLELSGSKLQQVPFPLPPLAEQKRIVAKLDALNAKSARARTELARIETLVSRYKQAVLSKAFSGELTVLNRSSWPSSTLGELAFDVRYGTAEKCTYAPEQTPVLRIPNVANGRIDLSDLKHASFNEKELKKLALAQGDLLVIRSNGSVDLVGRSAVVESTAAGMLFAGYLIRIRLDLKRASPFFIQYWMQSAEVRRTIEDAAKSTSGVNNVNSQQLQALKVSLPPLPEQNEIVRCIESAFAKIDRLEAEAKRALELVGKLDEAILAKAFRGELVPQDPNEEPASVLLERIRTERGAAPKPKRGRKAAS